MLVAGVLLMVFGAGRIALELYDLRREKRLFREGLIANATVSGRVTYPNDDQLQSSQYRLLGQFRDEDGVLHYVKSVRHASGAHSRELQGRSFKVYYLPEEPDFCRFDFDRRRMPDLLETAIMGILAAVGVLLVLAHFLADPAG